MTNFWYRSPQKSSSESHKSLNTLSWWSFSATRYYPLSKQGLDEQNDSCSRCLLQRFSLLRFHGDTAGYLLNGIIREVIPSLAKRIANYTDTAAVQVFYVVINYTAIVQMPRKMSICPMFLLFCIVNSSKRLRQACSLRSVLWTKRETKTLV